MKKDKAILEKTLILWHLARIYINGTERSQLFGEF